MKKFTFKTEKATGQYRSFQSDYHIIKYDKKECGYFQEKESFLINLRVLKDDIQEDGNPNCKWKWIRFKARFGTLSGAKEFLNRENIRKRIFEKYKLYLGE